MRSLRAGLAAGLVVSLVLIFVAQWAVVSYRIRAVAEGYVASRLRHDMESLLAALAVGRDVPPHLTSESLPLIYRQPLSGHYFRIDSGNGVIRSRSLWDTDLAVAPLAPGATRTLHLQGPASQPLLVLAGGFRKGGVDVTIALAEDLSEVNGAVESFRLQYAGLSALFLIALIAVQQWVIHRRLKPLVRIRAELERLERGEVETLRVQAPSEVAPVVAEVNRLLGVMVARLRRSRAALGNLAHALKGPMTLLGQLADEPAVAADPALRRKLTAHTQDIHRLIERELRRARFAGDAPGVRFVAAREMPALVQTLHQMYHRKHIELDCSVAPDAALPADREDMLEVLGNLLDNACKWSRGRVRLRVWDGAGFFVTVEDDGPGCAPEHLARLVQRGARLDESREGHGLGLSIAQQIVEDYGGRLVFDASPDLGGLRVTMRFPRPRKRAAAS